MAVPVLLSTMVCVPPGLAVYVTVALGVPVKVTVALLPEQTVVLAAIEAVGAGSTEMVIDPVTGLVQLGVPAVVMLTNV